MHTQETEHAGEHGLGPATKSVADHASALVRLELELAIGIGLGLGAALFLLYAIGFGLAAAAAGIATATSLWVALLIVTGALILLVLLLGLFAYVSVKKGTPPVPEQALREAKLTTEALKSDGHA